MHVSIDRSSAVTWALVCTMTLAGAPALAQPDPALLAGVWRARLTLPSGLAGPLHLERERTGWSASLSGRRTPARLNGSAVDFAFGATLGSFRGSLSAGGRTVEGFWVQPAVANGPPAYSSPLVLTRTSTDSYRGQVEPLTSHFTLYLKIAREPDGTLVGAFRNPELNSRGGAPQFTVTRTASGVRFSAKADPQSHEIDIDATMLEKPQRLRLTWPGLGRTLDLLRLSAAQAAAFYARPPGSTYTYRRPEQRADGWTTARARDAGMDEAALTRLVSRLAATDPAGRRPPLIHSLLVAHRGKLVLEEYFYGYSATDPHDLRSAAKTFASVLLGAAMMRGTKVSAQTHVYDALSAMGPFANPDPRKGQITVAQLLTHTSGLACDDNDDDSPGNEGTMQSQDQQPDWWKYTLDLPMAHDPGTRYAYCSGGTNLVGGVLTTATATWLPEYFDRTVARPLQFGPYYWNLMPNGQGYLGGGAFVRPRDFLKLGQTYLDGGVWKGRRLVAASWVADSTAPHIEITPETTGLTAEQFANSYVLGADGFAWHLSTLHVGDRTYREYGASGNGGQILSVVPDLDLVVAFTAGNYGQGGIWIPFRLQIIPQEIIPAIRS